MKGKYLIIAYLAAIFIFVLAKAATLPFTHDECQTYTIFAEHSGQGNTANNHWLNTWSAYLFYLVFGQSELAMRVPNLLAFILYLFYSFRFAQKFNNIGAQWASVVLLTAFPFMLDFFALMRGYGLALGFGLAALYHLLELTKTGNEKQHLEKALYFSLLAVVSNFTNLFFHFALAALALFLLWQRFGKELFTVQFKKIIVRPLIVNSIALSGVVYWVLFLKSRGQLYAGSDEGLFTGTFQSLVAAFLYQPEIGEGVNYMPWVWISVLIIAPVLVYSFWQKKSNPTFFSLGIFVALMCFIPVALNIVLGFNYPTDRGALVFYYPLMLLIPFALESISQRFPVFKMPSFIISGAVILVWLVTFVREANVSYYCLWHYDANTPTAVDLMRHGTDSVRIGSNWKTEPGVNFYIKKLGIKAQKTTKIESEPVEGLDFYYFFKNEKHLLPHQKTGILKEFPVSGTVVIVGME